ncbi:luciferase family protein [Streptomyces sparsogenes]|uniref:luciferase domain-containing protein n=1 Tax=Streptomyces sparsogenes TaxID=67365 RepID=UPI0034095985
MSVAHRAMERLRDWPDLDEGPACCGMGRALRMAECEIVHFHSDRDADLHLTEPAIRHLATHLGRSTAIRLVPDSQWVTVHLDTERDADVLLSLVSVALNAHARCAGAAPRRCNLNRVTFPDRRDHQMC